MYAHDCDFGAKNVVCNGLCLPVTISLVSKRSAIKSNLLYNTNLRRLMPLYVRLLDSHILLFDKLYSPQMVVTTKYTVRKT